LQVHLNRTTGCCSTASITGPPRHKILHSSQMPKLVSLERTPGQPKEFKAVFTKHDGQRWAG
jgi:hypothetical protein